MRIPRQILDSVVAHARESYPRECCGILMACGEDRQTVNFALRAENAEKGCPERRYMLGHRAHIKAIEREASGASCIAGYYHSHSQGGTKPSPEDRKYAVQGATYLIVSVRNGKAESALWRWTGKEFVPEALKLNG